MRSIREQLENGYKFAGLLEEVDSLPDELNSLFEHLLKSLRKPDRAYRTFAMVIQSKRARMHLFLIAYSFYDDYERDHEFAMRRPFSQRSVRDLSFRGTNQSRAQELAGYCGGLFKVVGEIGSHSTLAFTHRSVTEFLETQSAEPSQCLILRALTLQMPFLSSSSLRYG